MSHNVVGLVRDASRRYRLTERRLANATVLQDGNLLELAAACFVTRNTYLRAMSAFQN
jgi:hypothetical protein